MDSNFIKKFDDDTVEVLFKDQIGYLKIKNFS